MVDTLKMDELSLVQEARKGGRAAFGELVERYARAVLARQVACTHELASAEDLAQDTFVRAWQGLARLEDERAFGSWLLSIAGFVAAEWVRRKRSADRRLAPRGEPVTEALRESDLPLAEAVATLPPEAQQLLALRHGQGLSCDEIARELGRPIGTVTKALSRAYAELREKLVRA